MAVLLIIGILLFFLFVGYIRYIYRSSSRSPSSIRYDMDSHKPVHNTEYSRTRNPADFDSVLDNDKIGDPAYPNAQRDAVSKDWDEYRKMHNAALDPIKDEDRAKWIHPEI